MMTSPVITISIEITITKFIDGKFKITYLIINCVSSLNFMYNFVKINLDLLYLKLLS